jgi:hypothetical protein
LGINRIKPLVPYTNKQQNKLNTPIKVGSTTFYETDLFLPGILKETNNYPVGVLTFPYYLSVDDLSYYDVENGSTYYDNEKA